MALTRISTTKLYLPQNRTILAGCSYVCVDKATLLLIKMQLSIDNNEVLNVIDGAFTKW